MADLLVERRMSDRAFLAKYVLGVLAGVAMAALCFMIPVLHLFAFLGLLPVVGVFLYTRVARLGSTYRLYPDRLEVESGILGRKIENVELFRVRDVGLRQGLLGRLAGYGDVYLHSTDSSTPDLHIRAIDAPAEFYKQLRELVSNSRAQMRTMIVEEGKALPEP
jgi:membrane protein YdbS with pleckstrin-like domain